MLMLSGFVVMSHNFHITRHLVHLSNTQRFYCLTLKVTNATCILIYTETQFFFWVLSNEPVSTEGDKAKSVSRAHLLCNPRRCEFIALLNCLGIHLHRSITEARFKYVIH